MPLYVIRPDPPAQGQDWSAAVPGQYLYDITGITATLTTSSGPDAPTDVSGNGNNGTYTPAASSANFFAGALTGNDALNSAGFTPFPANVGFTSPIGAYDMTNSFTINFWRSLPAAGSPGFAFNVFDTIDNPVAGCAVDSNGRLRFYGRITTGFDAETAAGVMPRDGTWHMLTFAYRAGTQRGLIYFDGVLQALVTDTAGPVGAGTPDRAFLGIEADATVSAYGGYDEFAFLDYRLLAGDIAFLYAQAPVFDDYSTNMIAFGPTVYYHLDGAGSPAGGRQVTFSVTDGSDEVMRIPSGFTEAPSGGTFEYSWQPKLASSTQTADGATTTVAIPKLILPAGYTVGPTTLDLGGDDQWSDIAIWWDSSLMDALNGPGPYEYAPGVHLVYKQVTDAPITVF